MDNLMLRRRVLLGLLNEEYIIFADPEVERICAETWGDGIGLKPSQARAVTTLSTYFRGNTTIVSFDELGEYFTGLTSIYGNSSSPYGAFGGCTALESITLPTSVTSIGNSAFRGCSSLKTVNLENITSITTHAFRDCTSLEYVDVPSSVSSVDYRCFVNAARTGTLVIRGDLTKGANDSNLKAKNIIVYGDVNQSNYYALVSTYTETIRLLGDYNCTGSTGGILSNAGSNGSSSIEFFELMGVRTGKNSVFAANQAQYLAQGCIVHLGYSGVAMNSPATLVGSGTTVAKLSRVGKIYVGDGTSEAADQAVLDQYLAISSWANVSSKLDLWYNYDGEYKTPPTIPTI